MYSDGCRIGRSAARLWLILAAVLALASPGSCQNNNTSKATPSPPAQSPTRSLTPPDLILINGFLVFFMQVGFVSIEAGYGRSKNVRNILLKNMVDILLCGLCWWAIGYAFAHGDSAAGGFIGLSGFFSESISELDPWFFTFTFALATVTIVSGCLAERTNLVVYPIYTILMSIWVHPVAVHWAWSPTSWLQGVSDCKFLDFAGGTVVHVVGGAMGLVGATLCGPRIGRFEDGEPKALPGHDITSVSIGTLFLWFGWFGFNCGSLYMQPGAASINTGMAVDRVALNMVLSAAAAGLSALVVTSRSTGTVDLIVCTNGILCGLVAATPTCGYMAPWACLITGLLAGVAYLGCSRLLLKLQIDDPLDSTAVHLSSGMLGTLMNGALARPQYVEELMGSRCGGFVYSGQGGMLLGMQLLGVTVILAWTVAWSVACFMALRHLGRLRVDQTTELAGLDNIEHGGPAYPEFNMVTLQLHNPA